MDGLGNDDQGFDDGMGFGMQGQPMMMNQPQLFGGFSHDGSVSGLSGGAMYPDEGSGMGDDANDANDANDAKRRRIARVRRLFLHIA